jgi:hypothetical protein
MLSLLRHYLPIRKVLLLVSEALLLGLVVAVGMTAHLWRPSGSVMRELAELGSTVPGATLRAILSSVLVALIGQLALYLNELYDFRVASSRYDRFARFIAATGLAIVFALVGLAASVMWGSGALFEFPGLTLGQTIQALIFSLLFGFFVLYWWRRVFARAMHRFDLVESILILGRDALRRTVARERCRLPRGRRTRVGARQ